MTPQATVAAVTDAMLLGRPAPDVPVVVDAPAPPEDAGAPPEDVPAPVDVADVTAAPDRHTVDLSVPATAPAGSVFLLRSSVSDDAGNAWRAWCELGRPRSPRPAQLDALRTAAEPARTHRALPVVDGRVDIASAPGVGCLSDILRPARWIVDDPLVERAGEIDHLDGPALLRQ